MDAIIGFPEVAGQFEKPTFFLSGAASDYVQPEARPVIKTLFPKARFAKLNGAGHWLLKPRSSRRRHSLPRRAVREFSSGV